MFTGEINAFDPVAEIEQLPVWLEDETLAEALERHASTDVEARVASAHQLAQYSVQRSVEALSQMSAGDPAAAVRAAAVTSLGHIGHVSVFAPVLIAMADEAREVRASAARALSRLNFDRADAYVRVIETADQETLVRLAAACVTAGLARQALDRLASEDRRQAYEAFSLLSLVARGGQTGVILEVIEGGVNLKVRQSAARLLALQGDPEVAGRLRAIAADAGAPEELRAVIAESVARGEYAGSRDSADGE
ncbi:MAG: HEAT repeat domain-containing protein [Acidobacteria bacterium]|nr:HEAT repeat domain-containing protein [Acidobacteriota bacterium]